MDLFHLVSALLFLSTIDSSPLQTRLERELDEHRKCHSVQYFFIKSELNGLVIEVDSSGQGLVMGEKTGHGFMSPDQLFYIDHRAVTIRSALNDFALTHNRDTGYVGLSPFANSATQQWRVDVDMVRHADGDVLDISFYDDKPGAKVAKWRQHNGLNQLWEFQHISPLEYTFIMSRLDGRVLALENGSDAAETRLVLAYKKCPGVHAADQLFRVDLGSCSIHSALTDMVISYNAERELIVEAYTGSGAQQWKPDTLTFTGNGIKIRNQIDHEVMDVYYSGLGENKVIKWAEKTDVDAINQDWFLVHMIN